MRGVTWRVEWAKRRSLHLLAGAQRKVPWGVALTFDDGPSPSFTPRLLDVLRDLDARATFFVLGDNARAHPELIRRMQAEGHGLGTHSRTHAHFSTLDREEVAAEIEGGMVDLQLVLGRRVRTFRPPNGFVNPRVALAMRRARADAWLWTIDAEDYVPGQSADHVVGQCASVRDRDVILLHDGMAGVPDAVDRTVTLDAVPRIVELVRSKGLDLVAL